jgi:hypothetical protein
MFRNMTSVVILIGLHILLCNNNTMSCSGMRYWMLTAQFQNIPWLSLCLQSPSSHAVTEEFPELELISARHSTDRERFTVPMGFTPSHKS